MFILCPIPGEGRERSSERDHKQATMVNPLMHDLNPCLPHQFDQLRVEPSINNVITLKTSGQL